MEKKDEFAGAAGTLKVANVAGFSLAIGQMSFVLVLWLAFACIAFFYLRKGVERDSRLVTNHDDSVVILG